MKPWTRLRIRFDSPVRRRLWKWRNGLHERRRGHSFVRHHSQPNRCQECGGL